MADFVEKATLSAPSIQASSVLWTTAEGLTTIGVADGPDMVREVSGEDLLQQAMSEVSSDFAQPGIIYVQENGTLTTLSGYMPNDEVAVLAVAPLAGGSRDESENGGMDCAYQYLSNVDPQTMVSCGGEYQIYRADGEEVDTGEADELDPESQASAMSIKMENAGGTETADSSIAGEDSTAGPDEDQAGDGPDHPLGSSRNPIRIVQRGNEYTALQHLEPDQLSQILQVIQQQQLSTNGNGAVLYNPNEGSQVVYRILGADQSESPDAPSTSGKTKVTAGSRQAPFYQSKKTYRKRKKEDQDERADGVELSRQEKEERKKHRPRTRYGRVSKPPSYMVKDYKHIHPVDYDEDYDDSDGGYSDFKNSGDESDETKKRKKDDDAFANLDYSVGGRTKMNKCETCDKRYIGRGGLARHYRLNPSHGRVDEHSEDTSSEMTPSTLPPATPDSCDGSIEVAASSAGPSQTPLSISAVTAASVTTNSTSTKPAIKQSQLATSMTMSGQKRGRGRPPIHPQTDRRKAKLKEAMQQCSDDELFQVALPKLAGTVDLWEFLRTKSSVGNSTDVGAVNILREYETFRQQVRKVCHEKLSPVGGDNSNPVTAATSASTPDGRQESKSEASSDSPQQEHHESPVVDESIGYLEIATDELAMCLSLPVGRYYYKNSVQPSKPPDGSVVSALGERHAASESSSYTNGADNMTSLTCEDGVNSDGDGKTGAESSEGFHTLQLSCFSEAETESSAVKSSSSAEALLLPCTYQPSDDNDEIPDGNSTAPEISEDFTACDDGSKVNGDRSPGIVSLAANENGNEETSVSVEMIASALEDQSIGLTDGIKLKAANAEIRAAGFPDGSMPTSPNGCEQVDDVCAPNVDVGQNLVDGRNSVVGLPEVDGLDATGRELPDGLGNSDDVLDALFLNHDGQLTVYEPSQEQTT